MAASALMQLSTLCASVLVARLLGAAGFGLYSFVLGSASTALVLIQGSFGLLAVRFLAGLREQGGARIGRLLSDGSRSSLLVGGIAAVLLAGYASLQVDLADLPPAQHVAVLLALAATVPLAAIAQFKLSALTGLQEWRAVLRFSAAGGIATLVFPTSGAWAFGTAGACWGIAMAALLRWYMGNRLLEGFARDQDGPPGQAQPKEFRGMLGAFALPAFLTACTFSGSLWFGNVHLLGQPDGARQLGLFAAAYLLRTLVVFLPAQLGTASLALITGHFMAGRERDYRLVLFGSLVLAAVTSAVLAGGIVLATPFLLPLLGTEFVAAEGLVRLVMLAAVLEAVGTVANQHLTSRARMWRAFGWVALPRDLVFIACAVSLVPSMLAVGLAYALLASQATMLLGIMSAQLVGDRGRR